MDVKDQLLRREVKNQSELESALAAGDYPVCVGNEYFELTSGAKADAYGSSTVRATGSSTVTAYDSSTVTAYDSSTVTAYGSSTVTATGSSTVTAYGSSTVRAYGSSTVTAYGSSTVRATGSSTVTAYDSSTVTAYGSSTVRASRYAAVHKKSDKSNITGGVVIVIPPVETPLDWCDVHGVNVTFMDIVCLSCEGSGVGDEPTGLGDTPDVPNHDCLDCGGDGKKRESVALVYKAVNDDFSSPYGTSYAPGTVPVAPDWDGGIRECGGGLHFSPTPAHALSFHSDAKRFLACPVALSDISVHKDAAYPEKIKARGCCMPVYEVDIHMRRVWAEESPQ